MRPGRAIRGDGTVFTPAAIPDPGPTPAEQYDAASTDAERLAVVADVLGLAS